MFDLRMRRILGAIAALWLLFLARTFWLQTSGAEGARRSVAERLVTSLQVAPRRGSILDADGLVLARDDVDYDLTADAWGLGTTEWECACGRVVRTYESDPDGEDPAGRPGPCRTRTCAGRDLWVPTYAADRLALARLLGTTEEAFAESLARIRRDGWADARRAAEGRDARLARQVHRDRLQQARPLRRNVGQEAAMEVLLHPERYPGIRAEAKARRVTAEGLDAATLRILGTTGPLQADEIPAWRARLAEEGIEGAMLTRIPFGKSGVERTFDRVLRGSFGREVRRRDIHGRPTTRETVEPALDGVDLRLTLNAHYQAIADEALDGRPGALVAMDPGTGAILAMAGTAGDEPLPAVTGHIPGSVMKLLTGLVAVENGLAPRAGEVECLGRKSRPMGCEHEHGAPGIVEAMGESCNAYFGATGIRIGVRPMLDYAKRLNIAEPFGLGISLEGGGTEWTQRKHKAPWGRTDLSNVAIGQGKITLSPLQVAALYGTAANGGRPVRPHLIEGTGLPPGEPVFSTSTLDIIRRGLEATVATGTAKEAGLARFRAAGKTGTAQIPNRDGSWNAWFAGFAPAENPRIVVVVVLLDIKEYGGHAAAPVAARFLEAWAEREGAPR